MFRGVTSNRKSLSCYERTDLKSIFPQILASLVAASFHIGNGISLAYSAVIIAQLSEPTSDIKTTDSENSWIASVLIIAVLFSSIFSGILMDKVGRLNTIKIACIPGVVGWSVIALANNVPLIITGRFVIGISAAWGTSPALVYISEIASSNIRMSLMAFATTYVSLGMILMYLGGWLLPWRLLAWFSIIFMVIPCILCIFIHESPSWLILKGKLRRAEQSLEWLHSHQRQVSENNETYAELSMIKLQEEQVQNCARYAGNRTVQMVILEFLKPTGYKPLLFLSGLFLFHHFSGVFITMFYSISFIKEAGTNMDAYVASMMIGVVRLVMSILSLYLLNIFNRRTLLFISCLGMAGCMFIAGLYTKWIKEGITTQMWVPVAAILFYVVFSTIGFLNIPTMLIAELFPLEIRGIGYSITYSIYCGCMFGALQSYYNMKDYFGGATNLQWFFASVSLGGLAYTYLFIPETKGVKLDQITNYFKKGWIFVRRNRAGICK